MLANQMNTRTRGFARFDSQNWKKYIDQTCCCLGGWSLSASWGPNYSTTLEPIGPSQYYGIKRFKDGLYWANDVSLSSLGCFDTLQCTIPIGDISWWQAELSTKIGKLLLHTFQISAHILGPKTQYGHFRGGRGGGGGGECDLHAVN